ncbi:MAG: hypothetical protein PVJ43_08045 [Gemmatimonadales bacterium]|jgi:hypothetical protein
MLTFRQVASAVWTFLGFMLAAGVVLNMRYKPLDEGSAVFLDTWTGKIHREVAESPAPKAEEAHVTILGSGRNGVDILLLEELVERRTKSQEHNGPCRRVRFAFPAPGSRFPGR